MSKSYLEKEIIKIEFAGIVKYLRKKHEMTQEDLTHKTGLGLSTISKIEQGVYDITLFNLMRLAKGLDIDPGIIVSALYDFKEGKIKRAVFGVQGKINIKKPLK